MFNYAFSQIIFFKFSPNSVHSHHSNIMQLIFINIRYGSPRPRASVWETSRDGGMTFEPVQYYANDCMLYFGLPDDGPIVNADDVNCVTTTSL